VKVSGGVRPSSAPHGSKVASSESKLKKGSSLDVSPNSPQRDPSSVDSGLASVSEEHVTMDMRNQSQTLTIYVPSVSQTSSISDECSVDEEDTSMLSVTTASDKRVEYSKSASNIFPATAEQQGWHDSGETNSQAAPEDEVFGTVTEHVMNNYIEKDQISTEDFSNRPPHVTAVVQMRRASSEPPSNFTSPCLSSVTKLDHGRFATIGADYQRRQQQFFDVVGCNDDGGDIDDLDSDEEREEQSLVAAARKALSENADLDADFCTFCKELALSEDDILHSLSRKSIKIPVAATVQSNRSDFSVSTSFPYISSNDVNSLTVALPYSRLNSTVSKQSLALSHSVNKSSSTSSVSDYFARRPVSLAQGDVAMELSDLVNYIQPVKFKGFKECMPGGCVEMFSITETKAKKMCKKFPVEYSMYSQNQLSRVYPHALRIDSSNFNPAIFWQCGCQMAAMNYQTNDVALQYYNCMFQQNNGAGYLLKPLEQTQNSLSSTTSSQSRAIKLTFRLISAQNIPVSFPPSTTFEAQIEVYGVPVDISRPYRSPSVPSQSGCLVWSGDKAKFWTCVVSPHLASIRFSLQTSKLDELGCCMVPVSLLQSGYRHVMLEPPSGSLYNVPSLFLLIKTKEAKPLSLRQLSRRLSDARSVGFLRIYSVPGEIDSLILGVTERTTTADVIGMALQKTGLEYECGQFALAEVYDDQGMVYVLYSCVSKLIRLDN
jgi:hypothetical protein